MAWNRPSRVYERALRPPMALLETVTETSEATYWPQPVGC